MLGMWLALPRAWDLLVALGTGLNTNFLVRCQLTSAHGWSWLLTPRFLEGCVGAGWAAPSASSRLGTLVARPQLGMSWQGGCTCTGGRAARGDTHAR